MKKIFLFAVLLIGVSSCSSEYIEPRFFYRGDFSPSLVDGVENYMKKIAKQKGYRVFEKDRDQMRTLTQGQDAFFMSYYLEEKAILSIMNVGAGTVLTLSLNDYEIISIDELEQLATEVRDGLNKEFGIKLATANPNPKS